jgi:hypothetical protein
LGLALARAAGVKDRLHLLHAEGPVKQLDLIDDTLEKAVQPRLGMDSDPKRITICEVARSHGRIEN